MKSRKLFLLVFLLSVHWLRADSASPLKECWYDIAGKITPILPQKQGLTVLVFLRHDCPVANATLPVLQALHQELAKKGVTVVGIHCDESITTAEVLEHAKAYEATAIGATKTPEAAILNSTGNVAYLGRIDNLYLAPGKRRAQATSHDLTEALQALLSGKQPAEPRTKAVGCFIK